MTISTMTKLFAVVALGACELADAPPPLHSEAVVVPAPDAGTPPANPAAMAPARPRTLRNGRPANGNVHSRTASPVDEGSK